jgi:predicted ArsR family transcriptional regulator
MMARLLLETLTARLGADAAREELRTLGARLAAQFKPQLSPGPDRASAIASLMQSLGYEASAPGSETIEALNCVYHELAHRDQTVCELDLALIENLADAQVEHRACMARGDNACVFCLKPKAPSKTP